MFINEAPWEVAAWIAPGLLCFGVCAYVMKRVRAPYFSQVVKPGWFPSLILLHFLLLAATMLLAVGGYLVWNDGGWSMHTMALVLIAVTGTLIVVSQVIAWQIFSFIAVLVGGLILIGAGVCAVLAAVWAGFAGVAVHTPAIIVDAIAAVLLFVLAFFEIYLAVFGNSHIMGGVCPILSRGPAWPAPEVVLDACAEERVAARLALRAGVDLETGVEGDVDGDMEAGAGFGAGGSVGVGGGVGAGGGVGVGVGAGAGVGGSAGGSAGLGSEMGGGSMLTSQMASALAGIPFDVPNRLRGGAGKGGR